MKSIVSLLASGAFALVKATDWEKKLPLPSNPLVWGEVNFLHTTDIHGELSPPQAPGVRAQTIVSL
jgi:2',3'-cyclic-nucleotide 2'-phosphodiesterase (5'-nucleotidase family)